MKKISFHFQADELPVSELTAQDRALAVAADAMTTRAYAPYSRFLVGAAVRLADGTIVHGSNQENVAYPSGLCAERVALFSAGANHPGVEVDTIAIVARTERFDITEPLTPCGGCRQVICEYAHRQQRPIRLILVGADRAMIIDDANQLLPFAFKADGLRAGPVR
jgi:cytidine deaminase